MKKYIKIILPPLLGIFVVCVLKNINVPDIIIYRVEFVMNAVITCVTTLAGFVLTSISIIIGMSSSPIMKKIQEENGLAELVWIYSESLLFSLIVVVLFIIMGANIGDDNLISSGWIIICAGVLVSYIGSMVVAVAYLLLIIAKLPAKQSIELSKKPSAPTGDFR